MKNTTIELSLLIITSLILFFILFPMLINLYYLIFRKTQYRQLGKSSQIRLIRQLHDAVKELSATKTGAIITIMKKQDILNLRTDGIKVDANISSSLIISIFNKTSPIHDGAIIIGNNKILYAGTFYKITTKSVDNKYGARHRAAMGIAEQSDALTIVVSEENGTISLFLDNEIVPIKVSSFQDKLVEFLK